jgi:hypothetical protein
LQAQLLSLDCYLNDDNNFPITHLFPPGSSTQEANQNLEMELELELLRKEIMNLKQANFYMERQLSQSIEVCF